MAIVSLWNRKGGARGFPKQGLEPFILFLMNHLGNAFEFGTPRVYKRDRSGRRQGEFGTRGILDQADSKPEGERKKGEWDICTR